MARRHRRLHKCGGVLRGALYPKYVDTIGVFDCKGGIYEAYWDAPNKLVREPDYAQDDVIPTVCNPMRAILADSRMGGYNHFGGQVTNALYKDCHATTIQREPAGNFRNPYIYNDTDIYTLEAVTHMDDADLEPGVPPPPGP